MESAGSIAADDARREIREALIGRLCTQVRLGYAKVLFMGFGALAPDQPPDEHPLAEYELQTDFARWFLTGAPADSEVRLTREQAESHVQTVVGSAVRNVSIRGVGVSVHFTDGLALRINAFRERETLDDVAWSVRMPDGSHVAALCRGQFVRLARESPAESTPTAAPAPLTT